MFKLHQIVELHGIVGIVSKIEGRFVQIMWEVGTHDVDFVTSTAIQWGKSRRGLKFS